MSCMRKYAAYVATLNIHYCTNGLLQPNVVVFPVLAHDLAGSHVMSHIVWLELIDDEKRCELPRNCRRIADVTIDQRGRANLISRHVWYESSMCGSTKPLVCLSWHVLTLLAEHVGFGSFGCGGHWVMFDRLWEKLTALCPFSCMTSHWYSPGHQATFRHTGKHTDIYINTDIHNNHNICASFLSLQNEELRSSETWDPGICLPAVRRPGSGPNGPSHWSNLLICWPCFILKSHEIPSKC